MKSNWTFDQHCHHYWLEKPMSDWYTCIWCGAKESRQQRMNRPRSERSSWADVIKDISPEKMHFDAITFDDAITHSSLWTIEK